jgi:hypothetical protein
MVTSGIANQFWQHGSQIAESIATYIISRVMSDLGARVQRLNMEIMSLLTSNTPSGITTNQEHSAMQTPRQPMGNCRHTIGTEDSMYFD